MGPLGRAGVRPPSASPWPPCGRATPSIPRPGEHRTPQPQPTLYPLPSSWPTTTNPFATVRRTKKGLMTAQLPWR